MLYLLSPVLILEIVALICPLLCTCLESSEQALSFQEDTPHAGDLRTGYDAHEQQGPSGL